MVLVPLLLTFVAVPGCVPPAQAPQPRLPVERPTTAPPPPTQPAPVMDSTAAVAPGIWTYGTDTRGSRALFGQVNMDALFVIRCDRAARRIFVSVPGTMADTLTLRATGAVKAFAARPTGAAPPYVAVEIAPADTILDALAFSRGRFAVEVGARQTALPAWPEFTRVVEDCRA